jgi:hypothetical protein
VVVGHGEGAKKKNECARSSSANANFSPPVRAREKKHKERRRRANATRRGKGRAVKETRPRIEKVVSFNGEKGTPFPQKKKERKSANNTHTSPSLSSSLASPPSKKRAETYREATILSPSLFLFKISRVSLYPHKNLSLLSRVRGLRGRKLEKKRARLVSSIR